MGKVYRAPKEAGEKPSFAILHEQSYDAYAKAENAYAESVRNWAKKNGSGELAGEVIKFPVADNYARYVVYSLKPVTLILLETGDAYQYPYVNRLTAKDIKDAVEREKAFAKLFAKGGK